MLKIRLSRRGKKRQPSYRVVVTEAKFKRDGRYVERIGWFNPLTDPETYLINEGRALYWLSVGAQPTDAVKRLLKNQGTLDRLARLHKGESLEELVAEYEGVDLSAQVEEVEEKVEEVVEAVEETVEEAAESVAEAVEDVGESVAEVVSDEADEAEEEESADTAVSEEEETEETEAEESADDEADEAEETDADEADDDEKESA